MPSDLDRALARFRGDLASRERKTFAVLSGHYQAALKAVQTEILVATADLARFDDPADPSFTRRGRFTEAGMRRFRQQRLAALLDIVEREFGGFARQSAGVVDLERWHASLAGFDDARQLILNGFTPVPAGAIMPAITINRQAVIDLAAAVSPDTPLGKIFTEVGGEARRAVSDALVSGAIQGRNSREIGTEMARILSGQEARMQTIARTETHRVYRSASLQVMNDNKHLLKGWRWSSARDRRTCAACLALDGRIFQTDVPMKGHPNCRCSMAPVTKTWKELGYDVPEPMIVQETGAAWLKKQAPSVQRQILGNAAQAEYASGAVQLNDFVRLRQSRVWGSSYTRGSLQGAQERAGKRKEKAA